MTTAPQTLAEQIDAHAEEFGCTREEAAQRINERRRRATELAETTDPTILLPAIRDALKLTAKFERITKTVSTPPHYSLDTDRGVVPLGPSSKWATRPSEFAAAFIDNLHEMPAVPTGDKRRELFGMIARAAEPVSIGEEATDDGWTRAALRDYLNQRPPTDGPDDALTSEYPFTGTDDRVYLIGRGFSRWLLLTYQERLSAADLGRRLRGVGCEPDKVNVDIDGKRTSRAVWRLPDTLSE